MKYRKPTIKEVLICAGGLAVGAGIVGTVAYKNRGEYKDAIAAAKTESKQAKAELEKLKPGVGNLKMIPEDKRSDGEYFFSSNFDGEDTLLVSQARPNGAYRFQGIDLKDHSWYFGVTSNGDMHLCMNLEDYSVKERQKLIAAAKESGFAFGFMENADGTGNYTLVVNGTGTGYGLDVTNVSPNAGKLGLSDGEIDKLVENARATRKAPEPVAGPADANEPSEPGSVILDLSGAKDADKPAAKPKEAWYKCGIFPWNWF